MTNLYYCSRSPAQRRCHLANPPLCVCRARAHTHTHTHTGSGKTAFFRVLGGLWPISRGTIFAPISHDGRPDPDQVFLVPQRIYMASGTLAEQVHYPQAAELTAELEERLQALLDLVGVGYLSTR
jgi:ABC-type uncharacterized transport system fused permease/ATPase subunit